MLKVFVSCFVLTTFLAGCIGDDIIQDTVPEVVKIINPIDTLGKNDTWQFEARFTNNIGVEQQRNILWSSSDTSVLVIDNNGLATGAAKGIALVIAAAQLDDGFNISDTLSVVVDEETVTTPANRSGELKSTSSYLLKGKFEMTVEGNGVKLTFDSEYKASTSLPGLYVYFGNNPSSTANALEIGRVEVFDGAHSYTIPDVGLNDYSHILYWCKPFNVKVGEGKIN